MEHNDVRHKLSEYIDGAVTGKEQAAIEAHLKTCLQCSGALEELRKTIEHVKTVEETDPPAWMTQKIMAKVRTEAKGEKSIFQRLFYPLTVKLPIQAIAVLFVAVTGFYLYQAIQPASRLSEAPTHEFAARNEASPAGTVQDKHAKADGPAVRSKQVPQTPEYKSLDMKLEYEKPAPPAPMDKAETPAPTALTRPAERPVSAKEKSALANNEGVSKKRSAEPQAAARTMVQEQSAQSSGIMPNKGGISVVTGTSCKENPQVIGECFTVHGRLGLVNGTPSVRLWKTGTDRILGIAEGSFTLSGYRNLPETIEKQLNQDIYLYGDYIVCPFTPDKPGTMQHICIESVANLTIKRRSDQ